MREIYRSPPFNLGGYLARTVKYSDGSKATILHHREVMEQHLGRKLSPDEVVHHRNRDKRDNSPGNLEVATRSTHGKEHGKERPIEMIAITCPECGKHAFKQARTVRHCQGTQGKPGPFCGKSCSGRFNARKRIYG